MEKSSFSLQEVDEVDLMDVQSNEALCWVDHWILSSVVEADDALSWVENNNCHDELVEGGATSSSKLNTSTVTTPRTKKLSRVILPTRRLQDRKGRVQDRSNRIQHRPERVQDRTDRLQDRIGRVQDRSGRVQERSGRIEDRSERVQVRRIAYLPIEQSWDFENPCQR